MPRPGAGSAGAGLVTGMLLLGTVAAELAAPLLMKRYGYRPILAAGAVLLGIPALALLPGGPLVITVTASVARGLGFGPHRCRDRHPHGRAAAARPARRRTGPVRSRGRRAGSHCAPGRPLARWPLQLRGRCRMTAATALVPLATVPWLPDVGDRRTTGEFADVGQTAGFLAGLRQGRQLRPVPHLRGQHYSRRRDRLLPPARRRSIRRPRHGPACSPRPSPPRSAAGGQGGTATGTVTRACWGQGWPSRPSAWAP